MTDRIPPELATLAKARPPQTIEAVIARMKAIDAALPVPDGIAWFTKLYLQVTEAVHESVAAHAPGNARFVERLDVVFANLYFAALRTLAVKPASVPRAWAPLFEARSQRGIAPIQFALAGMNAHINRDLPVALVACARELGIDLLRAEAEHRDFGRVDKLLARTEARVKVWFATGFVGVVDEALGAADDRIAMWDVGRAREAAWVQAQTLWALRALPAAVSSRYLVTLDRIVGFAGRGLLVPVL